MTRRAPGRRRPASARPDDGPGGAPVAGMVVYGRNAVREALRGRRAVHRVWVTSAVAGEPWLHGAEVDVVDPARLEELCGSPDHQGACAEAAPYPYASPDGLLDAAEAVVLCLDQVQDPRNLGAICRVAECGGAAGVVIPERRSAEVTPVVCRTSAGAVEHLRVARVRNAADWLGQAKRTGAWVYGAATSADAEPWDAPNYGGRVVLVLGSEGTGLRPRVAATCDALVSLPLLGRVESLNVAAAAAALLYGILQNRRAHP